MYCIIFAESGFFFGSMVNFLSILSAKKSYGPNPRIPSICCINPVSSLIAINGKSSMHGDLSRSKQTVSFQIYPLRSVLPYFSCTISLETILPVDDSFIWYAPFFSPLFSPREEVTTSQFDPVSKLSSAYYGFG
jgi:hypothetical protein